MKKILPSQLKELEEALYFLKISELKTLCKRLSLNEKGRKGELIRRIYQFLQEGTHFESPQIPAVSKAAKRESYPLAPTTLILYGNYKNDARTRKFMKTLVGEHFHFTAAGQDWIRKQWIQGEPPTYAEFADFWQKTHEIQKQRKPTPKKEWAYINFTQKYLSTHPNASRSNLLEAWEKERERYVKVAFTIIENLQ